MTWQIDQKEVLIKICHECDVDVSDYLYTYNMHSGVSWNLVFYTACRNGSLRLVLLMIEKGVYKWDWGLTGACQAENIDLILLMIKKGASISKCDVIPSDDVILCLIQIGITDFGIFADNANRVKRWLKIADSELNSIMIADLASVVLQY